MAVDLDISPLDTIVRDTIQVYVLVTACINHDERKKVGFTSFFPRFACSDVLIQCIMSTTPHLLSNQTLY